MYKLDEQEKLIVRELIRDPRISDNKIANKTGVPLKTVNRKRKILEDKNFLNYYCLYNNTKEGAGTFAGRCLYIIVLKEGITRKGFVEKYNHSKKSSSFYPKHILFKMVGEYEGNVAVIALIESHKTDDLVEIYNAEIVPEIETFFGSGSIKKTVTIPISRNLRMLRNYLPAKNMNKGKIIDSWPNEFIFVDD